MNIFSSFRLGLVCLAGLGSAVALTSCHKEGHLDVSMAPRFEGKEVNIASYGDSVILASAVVKDGKVSFDYSQLENIDEPILAQMLVDGRTRACFVIEEGVTRIDTAFNVTGTPLNDRMSQLFSKADSIENLDDNGLYLKFVEKTYNENKDNPIGEFFVTEMVRYYDSARIDSVLKQAPVAVKNSKRIKRYIDAARLRSATAPGSHFTNFSARQPDGKMKSLADFAGKGKWTLVDFWASWCPYCIKEMPQLKQIYEKYNGKNFNMVGVAVRDKAPDTKDAVEKFKIPWNIIYNAGRIPYDIYGFTGIPHLMLISPDGTIVSRGETPAQIEKRLDQALGVSASPAQGV